MTERTDPGFGQVYGDTRQPHFITHDDVGVWMWRKGQRVRFYDAEGNEHGVEQPNVAPALVYAAWHGWRDPVAPAWLNDGSRAEARTRTRFPAREQD